MASGDQAYGLGVSDATGPLSVSQRTALTRIVQRARSVCGYGFGVYVGPLPSGRESALEQHALLPDPASAVLVAVDPSARAIEIVTGINVTVALDTRSCELAVLAMRSCFVADDLVGGIREGVTLLAEHARVPRVLHTEDID
ncbi:MAG: DUF5130 family protein [Actinobacteria bacterium]|nr:DUF5130 family protein [Actinomycetota bacterium]